MNVVFSRLGLIIALFLFFSIATVTAATYTVGGAGADYATLEALRTSGQLQDGDTIVLNGDDNSLTAPFTNTLTIKGMGKVSPTSSTGFINASGKNVTIDSDSLEFNGFNSSNGNSGVIHGSSVSLSGGINIFTNNSAVGVSYKEGWYTVYKEGSGGAIWSGTDVNVTGGINTFAGNMATDFGGAIYGGDTVTLSGGTNTFTGNSAHYGGAIGSNNNVTLSGGTNTFTDNSAGTGGAICNRYSNSNVTLSGGENTFTDNTAGGGGYGGAIDGDSVTLSGGTNTFTGNSAGYGGAIYGYNNVTLSGGTNTFTNNSVGSAEAISYHWKYGGAIHADYTLVLSGGENTFTDNTADCGGAIFGFTNVTLSGGTNTFIGNSANVDGGAILARANATLRATDGNFTFQGNRDRVGKVNEKANAIYMDNGNSYYGYSTLTLAAEAGQNIYFYDPVTSSSDRQNLTININPLATDKGKVVFDGSDYTRSVDRFSEVYGNTTVGNGELVLNGSVTYGADKNVGSFTLDENATLTSANGANRIQANQIMMNGTVNIAKGSALELAAAGGVNFNGILSIGLGTLAAPEMFAEMMMFSAFRAAAAPAVSTGLVVEGDLSFGSGAMVSLYWDDATAPTDGWSFDLYSLFSADNVLSLETLFFDMSAFDAYEGFTWERNDGILTLSYLANGGEGSVPEPATLAIIGLGLAGLGLARRRK